MLKIFLADLVYNTVKTNNTVPLNIAYLGAYIEKKYKDQVSIKLFKYPEVLEEALKESPPDILGTSHYSWNTNLSKSKDNDCYGWSTHPFATSGVRKVSA